MLSSLLRHLAKRKGGFSQWLRDEAVLFLDYYNDFSYDFNSNGEAVVMRRLSEQGCRTVFDVGANIGDWSTMAAAMLPDATIHAFELSESTRATLRANLAGERFCVPDFALGAEAGEFEYKDYGNGSTVNTLVASTYHDSDKPYTSRVAKVTTGDAYLASLGAPQIDLLKIDVEGAEFEVLEGFKEALRNHKIRVIQFEYGYANGDAGHLMKDFYSLLAAAGYEVGKIWTAGVRFRPFEYSMNNFDSGPNYLAVAKSEPALIEKLRSKV